MELDRLTIKSQSALQEAHRQASSRHHQQTEPDHVLYALLTDPEGAIFPCCISSGWCSKQSGRGRRGAGLEAEGLRRRGTGRPVAGHGASARGGRPRGRAAHGRVHLDGAHPPRAAPERRPCREAARRRGSDSRRRAGGVGRGPRESSGDVAEPGGHVPGARTFRTRPHRAGQERKLDPAIGRDEEIRRAIQVLSRRTKNNPVSIGEPGVGKTAIVEGWHNGSSTATSRSRSRTSDLIALDIGGMIAGASIAVSSRSGSRPSEGDRRFRRRDRHVHRRDAHDVGAARGRGSGGCGEHAEADAARGSCGSSVRPRWTSTDRTSRRTPPSSGGSSRCCRAADGGRRDRDPPRSQGALRGPPRVRTAIPRSWRRQSCPTAT